MTHPPAAPRGLRRRLVAPAIATAAVQVVMVLGDRMPSIDAIAYFESGRNLLDGHGYVRQGAPEVHFPPVAPVAYALLEKALGSEMAALRAWNLTWGLVAVALLTAVAWWISRDDDTTVATAWLVTPVGGLVALGIRGGSGSELFTVDLLIAAALVVLVALDPRTPRGRWARLGGPALAGALVGVAYLTRPEAIFPGLTIGIAAGAFAWRQRADRSGVGAVRSLAGLGLFLVVVAALAAPYVAHQHAATGAWALTGKSKDQSIGAWRAIAEGDRLERDRILYAIGPDGVTVGQPPRSLTALAREHPGQWLGIVAVNVRQTLVFYGLWQILPAFLLVPGLVQLWIDRRNRATRLLAAVAAWPVLTSLLFFSLPRYLMLTTAILIPYGAWGLVRWIGRRPAGPQRAWWAAVAALSVLSLAIATWPLLPGSPAAEHTEQRSAGRWIATHTAPGDRIMTRSYHVQGYAHRPVVALPYADYDEVLRYARTMGVRWLVADQPTIDGRRPELHDALFAPTAPPGLRLAHEFTERGRRVRIFELDPPPPPSRYPPQPLGYVGD